VNGANVPLVIGIFEQEKTGNGTKKSSVQMPAVNALTGGHVRNAFA
jgi:hypothetical protein